MNVSGFSKAVRLSDVPIGKLFVWRSGDNLSFGMGAGYPDQDGPTEGTVHFTHPNNEWNFHFVPKHGSDYLSVLILDNAELHVSEGHLRGSVSDYAAGDLVLVKGEAFFCIMLGERHSKRALVSVRTGEIIGTGSIPDTSFLVLPSWEISVPDSADRRVLYTRPGRP